MLVVIFVLGGAFALLFTIALALRGACTKFGMVVIALSALSFLLGSGVGIAVASFGYVFLMVAGKAESDAAKSR